MSQVTQETTSATQAESSPSNSPLTSPHRTQKSSNSAYSSGPAAKTPPSALSISTRPTGHHARTHTPVAQGNSLLDFTELKKALAAMVAGEAKPVAARTPAALAELEAQAFLTQLNRVLPAAGRDDTLPTAPSAPLRPDADPGRHGPLRVAVADIPA
jgi:hypothetical protein